MRLSGKKIKLALPIVLCAAVLFCPVQAVYAENLYNDSHITKKAVYSQDKWLYYDGEDHVCVCGYTGMDDKITIPSEINGKRVTQISAHKEKGVTNEETKFIFFDAGSINTAEVVVPEGVTSIDMYAFAYSKIKKIELPKSLVSVGIGAFQNCGELTSVTIPENVTRIGDYAFSHSGLTEIFLPQGLKSIGVGAFKSAPLTQLYIPDSVVNIDEYAFSQSKLEEITLPGNLAKLEYGLFYECSDLKKAFISEGALWLGCDIFNTCPNLEEVYFPSTLRETNQIFQNNRSLKKIYFAADEEECKSILGNEIMDGLTGKGMPFIGEPAEYYNDVTITFNTPVPLAKPVPYPKEPLKLDSVTILLIAAASSCLTITVIFLIMLIREKKRTAAIKAEEKKKEEEGFHPRVLGTWECKKCGTVNSPIGSYCYKCGRKR